MDAMHSAYIVVKRRFVAVLSLSFIFFFRKLLIFETSVPNSIKSASLMRTKRQGDLNMAEGTR
jgi:hypothetical protein